MLKKIDKILLKFEEPFIVLGICVMGITMAVQVFCRFFGTALVWSEELSIHVFAWTVFIGMSYGVRKKLHIRLELLDNILPKKILDILECLTAVIVIALLIALFKDSIIYAHDQMGVRSPSMGYPMGFVALVFPIACVLTVIRQVMDIIRIIRKEA